MIFPSAENISHTVELLDEHEDGESVGKCPIGEAQGVIYMSLE